MSGAKYIRDSKSGAVFIRDKESLSKLKMKHDFSAEIEALKADINTLKSEISNLKSILNKSN